MPETLTLTELTRILPLSRSALRALIRRGELPAERNGRQTCVRREAVEAFLIRCIQSLRGKSEPAAGNDIVTELPIAHELDELRGVRRFQTKVQINARMVATEGRILDISERGMRIHHSRALRIGSEGKLSFQVFGLQQTWVVRGKVVWSHLSSNGYTSGIALTGEPLLMRDAIDFLQQLGAIEPDNDSLQRKRESHLQRTHERNASVNGVRSKVETFIHDT